VYKAPTGGSMATIEELEKHIQKIESDAAREISQLKARSFRSEIRFEALLRLMTSKEIVSVNDYQEAVVQFQQMNSVLGQINNIPSIIDKVNAASEFNKSSNAISNKRMKIYADDLGIKKIIEDAGGTSDFTARIVLAKLPMSEPMSSFMKQFIDPTKNPSPDAIIPDQVVNP
jgi:hypothetical protein